MELSIVTSPMTPNQGWWQRALCTFENAATLQLPTGHFPVFGSRYERLQVVGQYQVTSDGAVWRG